MTPPQSELPKVFLSHRHADKQIASDIRTTLESWANFDIQIFQSDSPGHGAMIGKPLNDQLAKNLRDSHLVVLIFLAADDDWSYCMWECGVATDPDKLNPTNVVVFQFTDEAPRVFEDKVRVIVAENNLDAIRDFAIAFHRDEKFFPRLDRALCPKVADAEIDNRSKEFHELLLSHIPPGTPNEYPRWDHLKLGVALDKINEVRKRISEETENHPPGPTSKEKLQWTSEMVEAECKVRTGFGQAGRHFGYDPLRRDAKFTEYLLQLSEQSGESTKKCGESIFDEMARAILSFPAEPSWYRLRSAVQKNMWFVPIVSHARTLPHRDDNCMEFDLYLYEIPVVGNRAMIKAPS